jgi:hypothetical protein
MLVYRDFRLAVWLAHLHFRRNTESSLMREKRQELEGFLAFTVRRDILIAVRMTGRTGRAGSSMLVRLYGYYME